MLVPNAVMLMSVAKGHIDDDISKTQSQDPSMQDDACTVIELQLLPEVESVTLMV